MSAETINTISILSGAFSIGISVIAMLLSILFYFAGRNTEIRISTSLAKIEAQTDALQKLSSRQIDKLMKHAFDDSGQSATNDAMIQLMNNLSQIPITITTILRQPSNTTNDAQLVADLYSALYFYTAQTNYWSQFYLPKAADFDETDANHAHIKRIVDLSCSDFNAVVNYLATCNQSLLANSSLSEYLRVTKETWRHTVKSSSDVFVASSKS